MPNLNIKGSVLDDFGRYLPTPIIDKIVVENDKLKVSIALYFNFTEMDIEQQDVDDYIRALATNKLYVYVAYILGEERLTTMLEHSNVQVFGELYNRSARFKSTDVPLHDMNPNYQQVLFDANPTTGRFLRSNEKYYSDNDERIMQYVTTVELPISFYASFDPESSNLERTHNIGIQTTGVNDNIFQAEIRLQDSLGGLSLCAFTSWINLDTPTEATNPPMITTAVSDRTTSRGANSAGVIDRTFDRTEPDLMPALARQQVSNISYESVFRDGTLDTEPQLSYVDGQGATYNKTPIQAINGKLYKQDAYSLEQIVALFTSYVSDIVSDDEEVQAALDNISYIVQTYGDSSQLLLELNILRKTFPDKSTATPVGRLYDGFKSRFFGANEKVASGTSVVEQLYKSSKLVDARITPEGAVGTLREGGRSGQEPWKYNFIYPYKAGANANWDTTGGPADWIQGSWMTSVAVFTEDTSDEGQAAQKEFIKTGFWFFDYRLALRQYSQACTVLNYDALQQFVGGDQLNRYFTITDATVTKWRKDRDTEAPWGNRSGEYSKLATLTTQTGMTEITGYGDQIRNAPYSNTCTVEDLNTSSDFRPAGSWLQLRGIAGTDFNEQSKLVGFQFQDLEHNYDGNENQASDTFDEQVIYSFSVTLEDNTYKVLQQLYNTLNNYFTTEFEEYYQMAVENCSYNSIDGTFNDFFTEGIMAHYGTDTKSYPWYRMPVLINLHKHMLVGEFVDDEKLKENAEIIASSINPINGNLSSLEAFKNNCENFIASYYRVGSKIYNLISVAAPTIVTIGGDIDNLIMARPPLPISTIDATWDFTDTSLDTGPYGRVWGNLADTEIFANAPWSNSYTAGDFATEINSTFNTFLSRINAYIDLGHSLEGLYDNLFAGWNGTSGYGSTGDISSLIAGEQVSMGPYTDVNDGSIAETIIINSGAPAPGSATSSTRVKPSFDDFINVVFLYLFGHQSMGVGGVAYGAAAKWLEAMSGVESGGQVLATFADANGYGSWISSTNLGDIVVTPFTEQSSTEEVPPPWDDPVGMKWLVGLSQTEELYLRLEQLWISLGGRQWGCTPGYCVSDGYVIEGRAEPVETDDPDTGGAADNNNGNGDEDPANADLTI
jgi:hypothetical protein